MSVCVLGGCVWSYRSCLLLMDIGCMWEINQFLSLRNTFHDIGSVHALMKPAEHFILGRIRLISHNGTDTGINNSSANIDENNAGLFVKKKS